MIRPVNTIPRVYLSAQQRFKPRQIHTRPLIDDLAAWLAKSLATIAPKSQLGRTMLYMHRQWDKLTVFLESGQVPIHNDQAENKIRPFVIGRKNWCSVTRLRGLSLALAGNPPE
ncbi:MAG: transposase [Candidatus Azotimanducaceae bacterium]|jgi:transposase